MKSDVLVREGISTAESRLEISFFYFGASPGLAEKSQARSAEQSESSNTIRVD